MGGDILSEVCQAYYARQVELFGKADSTRQAMVPSLSGWGNIRGVRSDSDERSVSDAAVIFN